MSVVDVFTLSAPMMKLKCDCGESEMTVEKLPDGKVKLTVPCILCPKPHSFIVNPDVFFGEEELFLQCPYSEMNVALIGEMDHIKAELARGELELMEIMEANGITDLSAFREANEMDDGALDSEQTQNVIFVLSELEAENNEITVQLKLTRENAEQNKALIEEYEAKEGEIVVKMDPGMAFGTGSHETTRLVIELLEKIYKERC